MQQLKERVLSYIQLNGPVLPVQISKVVGRDLFFSGAILSELISEKKIKISNAKVGGSPVYYMRGQEEKLQALYKGLPEREKEAYDLLKNKKILRDKTVNPAIRVALRSIKDFAHPIYLDLENGPEIVWKWYLLKDEELTQTITKFKQPQQIRVQVQQVQTPQPIQVLPEIKSEVKLKEKQIKLKKEFKPDELLNKLTDYFKNNDIQIVEKNQVRKNKEYEFIAKVPSKLGNLDYLIVYKDKKKISETDLTLANNKGNSRKLPVLLLSSGDLSKKTELYREKNLKGYLIFKKI